MACGGTEEESDIDVDIHVFEIVLYVDDEVRIDELEIREWDST